MKFYIVKDQPCPVYRLPETLGQTFSFEIQISASDDAGTGTGSKYQKFEAAFKQRFASNSNPAKLEPLTVEFLNLKDKDEVSRGSSLGKWDILLRGNVLKQLHELLYHDNENVSLEIALHLTCRQVDTIKTFHIKGLNAVKDHQRVVDLACYKVKNVELQLPAESSRGFTWRLTVEVIGTDFMSAEDVLPVGLGIHSTIFKNRNFCDFELVSAEGTGVKCHKEFLAAHSSVFSNLLLGGNFKEAQENRMEMPEMSTRSLNAFLAFIYCDLVQEAFTYCDVALELLKAADMYDMPELWNAMAIILKEKSERWYSVEGALKLLDFIRNCNRKGERESLMQNVMKILAIKRDKLKGSTLYAEMFPTTVSREMFELLLEERVPKPSNPVDNVSVTMTVVGSNAVSSEYLTSPPQRRLSRQPRSEWVVFNPFFDY